MPTLKRKRDNTAVNDGSNSATAPDSTHPSFSSDLPSATDTDPAHYSIDTLPPKIKRQKLSRPKKPRRGRKKKKFCVQHFNYSSARHPRELFEMLQRSKVKCEEAQRLCISKASKHRRSLVLPSKDKLDPKWKLERSHERELRLKHLWQQVVFRLYYKIQFVRESASFNDAQKRTILQNIQLKNLQLNQILGMLREMALLEQVRDELNFQSADSGMQLFDMNSKTPLLTEASSSQDSTASEGNPSSSMSDVVSDASELSQPAESASSTSLFQDCVEATLAPFKTITPKLYTQLSTKMKLPFQVENSIVEQSPAKYSSSSEETKTEEPTMENTPPKRARRKGKMPFKNITNSDVTYENDRWQQHAEKRQITVSAARRRQLFDSAKAAAALQKQQEEQKHAPPANQNRNLSSTFTGVGSRRRRRKRDRKILQRLTQGGGGGAGSMQTDSDAFFDIPETTYGH